MSSQAATLIVRGVVQGVGFRYFVYRAATSLRLGGWTRNLPDGTVEVFVEGERSLIEELIAELKVGSSHASVSDVMVTWQEYQGTDTTFDIKGW